MDPRIKPEIFRQKVCCADCPFKRDGGVRHSVDMMASYISYFVTSPGATFPCHKSVDKSDPRTQWSEWQDGQVLCAGGLLFAAKQGAKNDLVRYAEHMGWYSQSEHAPEALAQVYDSVDEMLSVASDFVTVCPDCEGRGKVFDAPGNVLDGRASMERCPTCHGTGMV